MQAAVDFLPETASEEAGLAAVQDDRYHYRFTIGMENGTRILKLVSCKNHADTILAKCDLPREERIYLTIAATEEGYHFYYGCDDQTFLPLYENADPTLLSSLVNEGFTGTYLGMYASSNHQSSGNHADFDWVLYEGCRG